MKKENKKYLFCNVEKEDKVDIPIGKFSKTKRLFNMNKVYSKAEVIALLHFRYNLNILQYHNKYMINGVYMTTSTDDVLFFRSPRSPQLRSAGDGHRHVEYRRHHVYIVSTQWATEKAMTHHPTQLNCQHIQGQIQGSVQDPPPPLLGDPQTSKRGKKLEYTAF